MTERPVPQSCIGCYYHLPDTQVKAEDGTAKTIEACAAISYAAMIAPLIGKGKVGDAAAVVQDETLCGPKRMWYRNYKQGYHPTFPGGYRAPEPEQLEGQSA
jgi:hypothetical protein